MNITHNELSGFAAAKKPQEINSNMMSTKIVFFLPTVSSNFPERKAPNVAPNINRDPIHDPSSSVTVNQSCPLYKTGNVGDVQERQLPTTKKGKVTETKMAN